MKQYIFILLLIVSSPVFADRGCPIKEPIHQDSLVEIDLIADENTYLIKVKVPVEYRGEKFGMLMLHKGSDGDTYAIPLANELKAGKVHAWFYANESTLIDSKITVQYGEKCPTPIEAEINITKLSN